MNYNTACDVDRFDKFRQQMVVLANTRSLPKLMSIVIREMSSVILCESVGIFIAKANLILSKQLFEH